MCTYMYITKLKLYICIWLSKMKTVCMTFCVLGVSIPSFIYDFIDGHTMFTYHTFIHIESGSSTQKMIIIATTGHQERHTHCHIRF